MPTASVYNIAALFLSTSQLVEAMASKLKARTSGSVSGWRSHTHAAMPTHQTKKPANRSRQSPIHSTPCPIIGASTGTVINTVIIRLDTLAISTPLNRSRIMAVLTIRGPATPIPCSKRPHSSCSKLAAKKHISEPTKNNSIPPNKVRRRPNRSARGP